MKIRFQVVCTDAKNRPAEIPQSLWLEKDELYSVTSVQTMINQPGKQGFILAELPLPKESKYDSFLSDRFRPATEEDYEALEAVKKLLEEVEIGEFVHL